MGIKCKLGFHNWDGCKCTDCGKIRDEQHEWKGCKCLKCDKTRDEQHDWSQDCEKCSVCGKIRTNQHDWTKDCEKCSNCGKTRENQHSWNGCKCSKCGKTRDEQHDWSKDCEKCSKCGKAREKQHDWSKDCEKCSICGKARSNSHKFSGIKCITCGSSANETQTGILFHSAIMNRDINALKDMISMGINTNLKDKEGFTGMIKASLEGFTDVVKCLLDCDVDHSAHGVNDITPLSVAASQGNYEIVSLLLAKGADKDAKENTKKMTPLIFASAGGHVQIVTSLISSGADKFARDSTGMAAIHYAASKGHTDVVKILIEAGVDPNTMGEENYLARPIHYATLNGHAEVVQYLVKSGARTDLKDVSGNTPLKTAQIQNDNKVIQALSGNYKETKVKDPLKHYIPNHESTELIKKAVSEMQSGRINAAIDTLDKAVKCDNNNADAWGILGSLLSKNGDKRSSECFKEFIRIRPQSPDGYQQLIFSYSRTQRPDLAIKSAHTFTEVFPDDANAWAVLAALYVESADDKNVNGGIDKGIDYYKKALKLDPNNELAKKVLPSLYSRR